MIWSFITMNHIMKWSYKYFSYFLAVFVYHWLALFPEPCVNSILKCASLSHSSTSNIQSHLLLQNYSILNICQFRIHLFAEGGFLYKQFYCRSSTIDLKVIQLLLENCFWEHKNFRFKFFHFLDCLSYTSSDEVHRTITLLFSSRVRGTYLFQLFIFILFRTLLQCRFKFWSYIYSVFFICIGTST